MISFLTCSRIQSFSGITFFNKEALSKTGTETKQRSKQSNGLLDQLGTNLTDSARAGKIDPVIGRDKEINRVIETLNRRNKNNPVLNW